MEHAFNISDYYRVILSKSQQDPNKAIGAIWSLQKVVVEGGYSAVALNTMRTFPGLLGLVTGK